MPQNTIQPLAGYVVVKPQKKKKVTDSGIVLPDTNDDKPQQGTVIATGPATYVDGREVACPVKVNDVVIYREWGGKEYKQDEEELLLLKFDDLMATIK